MANPKRVLVTGSAGFIGSHTAEALLARGDWVLGLDNLNSYYSPVRKRHNVALTQEAGGARYEFVEGDIRDRALLSRLFERGRFDAVVHLAAMAGVRASVEDPHLYYDVNVTGTLNLLAEAACHKPKVFVMASTSSVYGNTKTVPFTETDPCDRPLAPYPASKRAAELLGHSYHHLFGLDVTVLRFFTVYGPRGRPDMMAYKVLDHLYGGVEVPLYNHGKMHRDWTYVSDIAGGIVAAVDRPQGYDIFNIGHGQPVFLGDFIEEIERLAGKKTQLTPTEMPAADIAYTYADTSKTERALGYRPQVTVQDGVRRFFDWYQAEVRAS